MKIFIFYLYLLCIEYMYYITYQLIIVLETMLIYFNQDELVDPYNVSICAKKTDLFIVSQFPFPLSSNTDLTFSVQLGGFFLEKKRTFTLPVHLVHAPSFWWSPSCSFFCYLFVCIILVTECSLLCMPVLHVWALSLDCFLLISAITLVTLSKQQSFLNSELYL